MDVLQFHSIRTILFINTVLYVTREGEGIQYSLPPQYQWLTGLSGGTRRGTNQIPENIFIDIKRLAIKKTYKIL